MFGSTYLAHPDLFPARAAGESWGERRLALALAGERVTVLGMSVAQREALATRLALAVDADDPDGTGSGAGVVVEVLRAARDDFRRFDLRGFEYLPEIDIGDGVVRLAGLGLMARLVEGPVLRAALWTPEPDGEGFAGVVETVLRVAVARRLLQRGGLLVHAAGVVRDGEAWVLAGRSGAGKSTAAGHAARAGMAVLSDDLVAVVPGDGGPEALRVPFTGDLRADAAAPERTPLRGWVRLEKSPEESCRRLRHGETVALLAACATGVNHDPGSAEALLAVAASLAATPAYALRLGAGRVPWSLLDACSAGEGRR